MKTTNYIIIATLIALLVPATASANIYEDRLKEAFDDIISAVSFPFSDKEASQMHTIYSDPETGVKEGQLDVYKFTLDNERIDLINNAKEAYEQLNGNSNADVYTLWWNDNHRDFQGYRLYYSPENAIVVGLACDHCYTVGFVAPDDKQHRTTYTIEWDDASADNDSISGRLITTYAPIKAKAANDGSRIITSGNINGHILAPAYSPDIDTDNFDKWIEQLQAGMEEYHNKGLEEYQKGMEEYQKSMEKAVEEYQAAKEKALAAKEKAQAAKEKAQNELNELDELSKLSRNNDLSDLFLRVPRDKSLTPSKPNAKDWMKKLLFYINKVQENGDRYLYLSKLYELCKDTEGLDQTDLKIAAKQLESVYRQLKDKKKLKESELLFLESMVDLLQSKIKN